MLNDSEKLSEDRVVASSTKIRIPKEYSSLFNENWIKTTH
jgi:hypothetical protein